MRFVVERDALAEAVAWIARSLPSRPVLPVLSGLLLQAAPGGLTLSCFDYEVSARVSIDAEVAEPGTALVPGRLLAEITRSLPGHPVEVDDADDVTLTCGPASFSLVTLPIADYPRLPELPRLAGTVDGGVFATAIGQVTPAASRDDTLPVITGVNLEIEGDTITLVATDRYRLAIRELGWHPAHAPGRSTLLVPAKTLADAARMMAPGVPVRILTRGTDGTPGPARRRLGGLAARGRRHDRVRIGRAAADHAPDRGRLHQVQLEVPGGLRQLRRHAGRARSPRRSGGWRWSPSAAARSGCPSSRGRSSSRPGPKGRRGPGRPSPPTSPARRPPSRSARSTCSTAWPPPWPPPPAARPPRIPAARATRERDAAPAPAEGRIRLQFTSPTKPALITGSPGGRRPVRPRLPLPGGAVALAGQRLTPLPAAGLGPG